MRVVWSSCFSLLPFISSFAPISIFSFLQSFYFQNHAIWDIYKLSPKKWYYLFSPSRLPPSLCNSAESIFRIHALISVWLQTSSFFFRRWKISHCFFAHHLISLFELSLKYYLSILPSLLLTYTFIPLFSDRKMKLLFVTVALCLALSVVKVSAKSCIATSVRQIYI